MSKITFTENGREYWFDPETGEFEYEGSHPLVRKMLEYMDEFKTIRTSTIDGVDTHPGEVWDDISPEERKEKVLNYLSRVNGVEVNERQKANNH